MVVLCAEVDVHIGVCLVQGLDAFRSSDEADELDALCAVLLDLIKDVDKSEVIDSNLIESPVLGKISPLALSGGTKTLILIINDKEKIFNASTCGNNCAKWLLKISENEDVTINLRHLMDFGAGRFNIKVLNTEKIVHNMSELLDEAMAYV